MAVWTFFFLVCYFSFLSPFLWKTARYRLTYCLKGPLSPKQPIIGSFSFLFIKESKHVELSYVLIITKAQCGSTVVWPKKSFDVTLSLNCTDLYKRE